MQHGIWNMEYRMWRKGKKASLPYSGGFTLVETMLYIVIATSMLYAVSILYNVIVISEAESDVRGRVTDTSFHALRIITDAVRRSEGVTTPERQSIDGQLVLEMNDADINPTVFSLSGDGVIEMQEGSNPPIPLTSPDILVSTIQFENPSLTELSDSVHIQFDAENRNSTGRRETTYVRTFYGSATTK